MPVDKYLSILLQKSDPFLKWGFDVVGGKDLESPLIISKVDNSTFCSHYLSEGDVILQIDGIDATTLSHAESLAFIKRPSKSLDLVIYKNSAHSKLSRKSSQSSNDSGNVLADNESSACSSRSNTLDSRRRRFQEDAKYPSSCADDGYYTANSDEISLCKGGVVDSRISTLKRNTYLLKEQRDKKHKDDYRKRSASVPPKNAHQRITGDTHSSSDESSPNCLPKSSRNKSYNKVGRDCFENKKNSRNSYPNLENNDPSCRWPNNFKSRSKPFDDCHLNSSETLNDQTRLDNQILRRYYQERKNFWNNLQKGRSPFCDKDEEISARTTRQSSEEITRESRQRNSVEEKIKLYKTMSTTEQISTNKNQIKIDSGVKITKLPANVLVDPEKYKINFLDETSVPFATTNDGCFISNSTCTSDQPGRSKQPHSSPAMADHASPSAQQYFTQTDGVNNGPPPPPPPPAPGLNTSTIPSMRLKSEIPDILQPPATIQNAMMTKDKKPFTYTPGGIDLSQIKSPTMQRRILRNAQSPPDNVLPPTNTGRVSPLPPSMAAAVTPHLAVPVLPQNGVSRNNHYNQNQANTTHSQANNQIHKSETRYKDSSENGSSPIARNSNTAPSIGSVYINNNTSKNFPEPSSLPLSSNGSSPVTYPQLNKAPTPWMQKSMCQANENAPSWISRNSDNYNNSNSHDTKVAVMRTNKISDQNTPSSQASYVVPIQMDDNIGNVSQNNGGATTRIIPIQLEGTSIVAVAAPQGNFNIEQNRRRNRWGGNVVDSTQSVQNPNVITDNSVNNRTWNNNDKNTLNREPESDNPIQSRSFKVIEKITGPDKGQECAQNIYIPPSERQVEQGVRKYTGSSIPSRSFRMLQAMTAIESSATEKTAGNATCKNTNEELKHTPCIFDLNSCSEIPPNNWPYLPQSEDEIRLLWSDYQYLHFLISNCKFNATFDSPCKEEHFITNLNKNTNMPNAVETKFECCVNNTNLVVENRTVLENNENDQKLSSASIENMSKLITCNDFLVGSESCRTEETLVINDELLSPNETCNNKFTTTDTAETNSLLNVKPVLNLDSYCKPEGPLSTVSNLSNANHENAMIYKSANVGEKLILPENNECSINGQSDDKMLLNESSIIVAQNDINDEINRNRRMSYPVPVMTNKNDNCAEQCLKQDYIRDKMLSVRVNDDCETDLSGAMCVPSKIKLRCESPIDFWKELSKDEDDLYYKPKADKVFLDAKASEKDDNILSNVARIGMADNNFLDTGCEMHGFERTCSDSVFCSDESRLVINNDMYGDNTENAFETSNNGTDLVNKIHVAYKKDEVHNSLDRNNKDANSNSAVHMTDNNYCASDDDKSGNGNDAYDNKDGNCEAVESKDENSNDQNEFDLVVQKIENISELELLHYEKDQDTSEIDNDSGLISENANIKCSPINDERTIMSYNRAGTHSRLYKLLQEEDKKHNINEKSPKNSLTLSLCSSSASSSGINSPSTPTISDKLHNEIVCDALQDVIKYDISTYSKQKIKEITVRTLHEDLKKEKGRCQSPTVLQPSLQYDTIISDKKYSSRPRSLYDMESTFYYPGFDILPSKAFKDLCEYTQMGRCTPTSWAKCPRSRTQKCLSFPNNLYSHTNS